MDMSPAEFAAYRHLVGLTVEELGEKLGVDPRTVRGWESGQECISESAGDALRGIVDSHSGLVHQLLDEAEGSAIFVDRTGWNLAAIARVLAENPGVMVEWEAA